MGYAAVWPVPGARSIAVRKIGGLPRPDVSPTSAGQAQFRALGYSTMASSEPIQDPQLLSHDRRWLFGLATELQRTLDVTELLHTFSQRAAELVQHTHLGFTADHDAQSFCVGTKAPFACSYELALPEQCLGLLEFTRESAFSENDAQTLENLIVNLVYPLRNALMYEEVVRASGKDALTGLGNRASLETSLAREFAAANRHGEALSVIMFDIDHFKRVNDEHGHLAGDDALRALAHLVSDEIRDCDLAFRYGGEEFVVVLAKTDLNGAILLAERIRKRTESTRIECAEVRLGMTLSLGVTSLESGDTQASLLGRADEALYASKSGGRNRVSARTRIDERDAGSTHPAPKPAQA